MSGDREELIRQRAYALWEKDGGRHGLHDDHWAQATREIDGDAKPKAKRAPRTVKPQAIGAKGASKAPVTAKTVGAAKPHANAAKAKPAKPPEPAVRGKRKVG
jgi:hypothetical protein